MQNIALFRSRMGLTTIVALCGLISMTAQAGDEAVINLGPIKPLKPGFGQSAQFSAFVSQNGKPISRVSVEFWFSGRHGIRTPSWYAATNNEGRATFTRTIPREWRYEDTWVDLNASCDKAAASNNWRVRGK